MISNQILQNTIEGLKSITRIDLGVMDTDGKTLATTFPEPGDYENAVLSFVESPAESQVIQGYQFFKIYDEHQLEYLLLDNLLLVDIYNRAKKLHIDTEVKRDIFIVETSRERDVSALDSLRSVLGGKGKDFITAVDEKNIIVVKELGPGDGYPEMDKTAHEILDLLKAEGEENVRIAYGTIVNDIKEVSKSYKEAKLALDVGKIFFDEKEVIAYSALGIGRLIYQLPIPLCKMFIREIFEGKSPDEFDEETLTTINKFFENSLNVSETSRQLYIHRNTLVYRLDKLQKSTGLDLRVFEDAITFKIALMVVKYMKYMETLEY